MKDATTKYGVGVKLGTLYGIIVFKTMTKYRRLILITSLLGVMISLTSINLTSKTPNYHHPKNRNQKQHGKLILPIEERCLSELKFYLKSHHISMDEEATKSCASGVAKAYRRFRLPPTLIFSLIHAESNFTPTAISRNGAVGLMQVQPKTAYEVARNYRIPVENGLFDIETNILIGSAYLRKLQREYKENLTLALTAYNIGPNKMDGLKGKKRSNPSLLDEEVFSLQNQFSILICGN